MLYQIFHICMYYIIQYRIYHIKYMMYTIHYIRYYVLEIDELGASIDESFERYSVLSLVPRSSRKICLIFHRSFTSLPRTKLCSAAPTQLPTYIDLCCTTVVSRIAESD